MEFNAEISNAVGPKSPQTVLLMLHGYGSNGADMSDYAQQLTPYFPQTAFVAPNAPYVIGEDSYAWYELEMNGAGDFPLAQEKYCQKLKEICFEKTKYISMLIDKIKLKYSVKNSQIGILGFSQGGLLALVSGLTIQPELACIIASSSIPLVQDGENAFVRSHPPCLLTHGQTDEVVPPVAMRLTDQTLQKAGISVKTCLSPFLSHGIDDVCQQATIRFLQHLWQ